MKDYGGDSSSVASQLKSDVKEIYSNANGRAFAAERRWVCDHRGRKDYGGDSSSVAGQLKR